MIRERFRSVGAASLRAFRLFGVVHVLATGCGGESESSTGGQVDACKDVSKPSSADAPLGRVAAVSLSGSNACAVFEDGSMRCWGDNTYGQLGNDSFVGGRYPEQSSGVPPILHAGVGAQHMCALTSEGCVWCWGDNSGGAIGASDLAGSLTPVPVDGLGKVAVLSTWGEANVALREDGKVFWWGRRGFAGFSPSPELWFDSAKGSLYRSVDIGSQFACGLRVDGKVECWGDNRYGQLGTGDEVDRSDPTAIVDLNDVIQIAIGSWSACAVRADKSLWCWGRNGHGQLGDGTIDDRPAPQQVALADVEEVTVVTSHTCARTTAGHVWCWGDNGFKQIGNGAMGDLIVQPWEIGSIEDARAIAAGSSATCAVRGDHDIWCWGYNKAGELGDGTYTNSSTPVQVAWDPPP